MLLNRTVMRLTQLGMPVKSMLVPLVLATAVAEVMTLAPITGEPLIVGLVIEGLVSVLLVSVCVTSVPTRVVVASGSETVRLLFVLGAATVTVPVPLALPWI